MRRIVAAAIRESGVVYQVPPPGRHHNVMLMMRDNHRFTYIRGEEQGFVCDDGSYVDRKEGMKIAREAAQIIPRNGGYANGRINETDTLFSEDLW